MSIRLSRLLCVVGLASAFTPPSLLFAGYLLDDDGCRTSEMTTDFVGTGSFDCAIECAITYAGLIRTLSGDCCVGNNSSPLEFCADARCNTSGQASASCGVDIHDACGAFHTLWHSHADAMAWANCSSGQVSLHGQNSIFHCSFQQNCSNLSNAWALAVSQVIFTANGSWTYQIDSSGQYYDEHSLAGFQRRVRGAIYVPGNNGTPVSISLIEMPGGIEFRGMQLDNANVLSGTLSGIGPSGSNDGMLYSGSFEEKGWDLDNDGRFNELDVQVLYSVVGTPNDTDPQYVPKFDVDGNGRIESSDVDLFQSIVDVSLDSGILADLDGDGDTDCADYALMGSNWSYTIGDGNYRVEADADLDGDNDSLDFNAVYAILQPADVNNDGVVNTADFIAFNNWWASQNPLADVNNDGIVNTADYVLFLNLWNNPC